MLLKAITSLKQLRQAISGDMVWECHPHGLQEVLLVGHFILIHKDKLHYPSNDDWYYAKILRCEGNFMTIAYVLNGDLLGSPKRQEIDQGNRPFFYLFECVP